jgi:hypothetical protein
MDANEYNHILQELMIKLSVVESKITGAKALNGGFDQLIDDVAEIGTDVRSIKKAMYEPDSGMFSRIKDLETESIRRLEFIVETKPMIAEHQALLLWKVRAEKSLDSIELLTEEVRDLVSWKSAASKFIWALVMLTTASWFKAFMDMTG